MIFNNFYLFSLQQDSLTYELISDNKGRSGLSYFYIQPQTGSISILRPLTQAPDNDYSVSFTWFSYFCCFVSRFFYLSSIAMQACVTFSRNHVRTTKMSECTCMRTCKHRQINRQKHTLTDTLTDTLSHRDTRIHRCMHMTVYRHINAGEYIHLACKISTPF